MFSRLDIFLLTETEMIAAEGEESGGMLSVYSSGERKTGRENTKLEMNLL